MGTTAEQHETIVDLPIEGMTRAAMAGSRPFVVSNSLRARRLRTVS